jgi:hypothetical protein
MAINKEVKKKVIEDWQNAFLQLTVYAQNKAYKVVGSCILGIELIKSSNAENYSPYFVLYPLWKQDVKACLNYPIILKDFKNKKGIQVEVPYEKHSSFFYDIVESVKEQTPLLVEGNISFKRISALIDECSKTRPLNAAPNSYLQAVLEEARVKIALSFSSEKAQNVFDQIKNRTWDEIHFKTCGVNVSEWLHSIYETICNREEFLTQIEKNIQENKISKLKSFNFID